jgi:hypothetical protein
MMVTVSQIRMMPPKSSEVQKNHCEFIRAIHLAPLDP